MSLVATAQRAKFKNDTFVHLEAIYRTSLWLTMRSSLATDLVLRAMTSAYCEWHTSKVQVSDKTHLFRILSREFLAPEKHRRIEHQTGKFLSENDGHVVDHEERSLQHLRSETETMQQLLKSDASSASVKGAIARLRPKTRLIMVLLYRERFSYEEIAYITDLSRATVRTILTRLRKMIPGYILEKTDAVSDTIDNQPVLRSTDTNSDHDATIISTNSLFGYDRGQSAVTAFQRWENEGGAVIRLK